MIVQQDPVVIVSAARTPIGGLLGDLQSKTAHQLGAIAIKAAAERAGVAPDEVEAVVMGNVLMAGQGQAPARQAALGAGLSFATDCSTINKVCGSGLQAVMYANDLLLVGTRDVIIAGGMESMSNAPHLLRRARTGIRFGHGEIKDHMALDGLEDAYEEGTAMGVYAEDCAARYKFSREAQDQFAIASTRRAQQAIQDGSFAAEIVPVVVSTGKGETRTVVHDEQPLKARLEKVTQLPPAFRSGGTVTAASSSSISDGAAALVLMRLSHAKRRGLTPRAAVVAHSSHSQAPKQFITAPVGALTRLFRKTGWSAKEVDLFEVNEAFAVTPMAFMREHRIPHEKVNVHGGACALGHPIGASGARIVVTLLGALDKYRLRRGVATLCIGGGEAVAIAIERMP
jgi:acetyl-CoA C-acetyltransferase